MRSVCAVGIGIIGTGNMGGAMWQRLNERNIEAEVFDLRRETALAAGRDALPNRHRRSWRRATS